MTCHLLHPKHPRQPLGVSIEFHKGQLAAFTLVKFTHGTKRWAKKSPAAFGGVRASRALQALWRGRTKESRAACSNATVGVPFQTRAGPSRKELPRRRGPRGRFSWKAAHGERFKEPSLKALAELAPKEAPGGLPGLASAKWRD